MKALPLTFIAHDLVLETLRILEEEGVIPGRRVLGILSWWTHDRGAYLLQLGMELVDFGARCGPEREMVKRPGSSSMDGLARESAPR
jgi:hypothetical protein